MADLATCYFCGGVDGVEEHPVIPEELDPPADEQRTVAVCPDCRLKFDRAVEPLVRFLGTGESPASVESSGSPTSEELESDDGGSDESGSPLGSVRGDESEETAEESQGSGASAERESSDVESDDDSDDTGEVELPDASREILRLLQNREFPVDRNEIETVAETAYELGPHETSEAIDALVDYGVLEEENGQLDRAE